MTRQPSAIILSIFILLVAVFFASYGPFFITFMFKPATKGDALYAVLVPSAIAIGCSYYAIDLIKFPGAIFKARPLHAKLLTTIIIIFILWLIVTNIYLQTFK